MLIALVVLVVVTGLELIFLALIVKSLRIIRSFLWQQERHAETVVSLLGGINSWMRTASEERLEVLEILE